VNLNAKLNVATSSSALFDLAEADGVFREKGLAAYREYQRARERDILKPGPAFGLIKTLAGIRDAAGNSLVNIQLISRNCSDSGLRALHSMQEYGLPLDRSAFTNGAPHIDYLAAYDTDLFLSTNMGDVKSALAAGHTAACVYPSIHKTGEGQLRLAFDGDCVLFSDEAEKIYAEQGFEPYVRHEVANEDKPLPPGPFFKFLQKIQEIQSMFPAGACPIRTALVTARSFPTHIRPIITLRHWGIQIDESFFLGGHDKTGVLKVFKPHLFFDDQAKHCDRAAAVVPTAQVPTVTTEKNNGS
jgi:5'-nucleotidase